MLVVHDIEGLLIMEKEESDEMEVKLEKEDLDGGGEREAY